ncbi:MAG: acetyltransferase [Rhodospirillales bacterium]|nr:acetyltransferase [Rhodospirillales bacterium]
MTEDFGISLALMAEDIRAVSKLFEGYAASLPVDLAYQDFAAELAGLPGKYSPPRGALLIARGDGNAPLGCAALRPLSAECCEMKRLYLVPASRGLGLGRAMTIAVIGEARRLGYRQLRLDTLPTMKTAQALYEQLGFEPIPPYYEPTPIGTVFMSLKL